MGLMSKAVKGIKYPSLVTRFIYRQTVGGGGNPNGVSVFEQDWDNLIILDACRADAFSDVVAPEIDGSMSIAESRGTATVEWIRRNFSGRELADTVYVSANGWLHRIQDEIGTTIHAADWLYTSRYRNEMGTVQPGVVAERALTFANQYPNKRLIVHFVQPHKPFLGKTAEEHFAHAEGINMDEMLRQAPEATIGDLQAAYRETLEIALPSIKKLASGLKGKTIITSDHGELLGERYPLLPFRNYGHPVGIYVPELTRVPWFECEWSDRRKIIEEEPRQPNQQATEELENHLRAMGYK